MQITSSYDCGALNANSSGPMFAVDTELVLEWRVHLIVFPHLNPILLNVDLE